MSASGSSRLQVLFEAALQDYQTQTGIALAVVAEHPLADQLQSCDSVDSVAAVLCDQTQAFNEFRGKDKVLKPLKTVLSHLHKLSAVGKAIGLPFPFLKAIHAGLGVLFSAVKGVIDSYDALVDLLESFDHFLKRLDIYDEVPLTSGVTEVVVKILVELLSALALATKQIKMGKPKKLVKRLLGEKDIEAVLHRLDRLTEEEARITAAQTFTVVHGLIQNMKVVMDDGKASADHVMESLKIMKQIASDLNRSKRDSLQKDIYRWLSPPDPWKNHHIACESRHRGSAAWFIHGNNFSEWKACNSRNSLLWVHGKPGAGKSVFCSTIIENIDTMWEADLASLAFFYCDFREDEKTGLRGLLSSLLVQLCHQADPYCDILFKFYSEHAKGFRRPSDDALVGCLKDLLKLTGLPPVYLIVDALDECPNISALRSPRAKVLNLIQELIKSPISFLRICVTSRPLIDIKDVLDPLIVCSERSVSLEDQSEQKRDIEDYIKSVINTHPENKGWNAEHKQLVIGVLTDKADGMFRWVECQADYICGCIPAHIQYALADLPDTLDETYQRTLREIKMAHWEFAHRLFQFVAVASRPLRVDELAELLAFDFKAGPIPKFHEDLRLKDPVDAVLSTCSSLLSIVDYRYSSTNIKVIQFSHFSVKEYLTSARLAETNDIISRRYHVSTTPAHTLAAQACLGILLHLDKDIVTTDNLEKWPFADYAAEHWADHARFEGVAQNVEDGMKQLFDPRKPNFLAVCVRIHDPWKQTQLFEGPKPSVGTPLHYAALWGLHFLVEFLVVEHSQDVNSQGFTDNATPLHLASKRGHVKAARMLIEHGANVMARNEDGETPLHSASRENQVEVAHMLIECGADVAAQNKDQETPLHLALIWGQAEAAHMLTKRGADVKAVNKDRDTPLHMALIWGQVDDVARMLIKRGADVKALNKDGDTPLHLASQEGQVGVARMLIESGAHVMAQNKDGETPLHLASFYGQVEVARMLIDLDADVTAQNEHGETPLHQASFWGQVEVALMLIDRRADVRARNKYGLTPLHLASQEGQVEVTGLLIKRGADSTAQNKDGETPLHLASREGQVEVARMLIEHGADVAALNQDRMTALHLASFRGQVEVVRTLIERGANVTAQNKYGLTPLHLAWQEEQFEVAGMLMECGANVAA